MAKHPTIPGLLPLVSDLDVDFSVTFRTCLYTRNTMPIDFQGSHPAGTIVLFAIREENAFAVPRTKRTHPAPKPVGSGAMFFMNHSLPELLVSMRAVTVK
ncbi:hypothetical protein H0H87_002001 [Tephrocybe sp. NHM501043]|nr:hypothetical protein H0H87_002001 [Tephrocybe sp. NHM501043]